MKYLGFLLFTVALVFSGNLFAAPSVSVTFVLDESGSVSSSNFQLENQGFINALNGLPTDGSVEISIVGFASSSQTLQSPTVLTAANFAAVKATLEGNSQSGGLTNMSGAIDSAASLLSSSSATTKIVCLATDGVPNSASATTTAATNAKNAGVTLSPIGINLSSSAKTFLDSIASNPPVPNPSDFTEFGTVVRNSCVGLVNSALNVKLEPSNITYGVFSDSEPDLCTGEKNITLLNSSNQKAEIIDVSISGDDFSAFNWSSIGGISPGDINLPSIDPIQLAANSETKIGVRFKPISAPVSGSTYAGSIRIVVRDKDDTSKISTLITQLNASKSSSDADTFCINIFDAFRVIKDISSSGSLIGADLSESVVDELFISNIRKSPEYTGGHLKRKGIVSDGNTRLFLNVQTLKTTGSVRFEIVLPTQTEAKLYPLDNSPTYSDVNQTQYDTNGKTIIDLPILLDPDGYGQATAILKAGESFGGSSGQEDIKFSVRACLLDSNGDCTGDYITEVLTERRAPVLLIHGLWADHTSWDDLEKTINGKVVIVKGLKNALYDAGHTNVGTIDYDNWISPVDQAGFKHPSQLNKHIALLCNQERVRDIACSRVDIVGHSMGGLYAEQFINTQSSFYNYQNFNQGAIRRFLTLGTPHNGSGIADLLTVQDKDIGNCFRNKSIVVKYVTQGDTIGIDEDGNSCTVGPHAHIHGLNDDGKICVSEVLRDITAFEAVKLSAPTESEKNDGYESIYSSAHNIIYTETLIALSDIFFDHDPRFGSALDYLTYSNNERQSVSDIKQYVKSSSLVGDIGTQLIDESPLIGLLANAAVFQFTSCTYDSIMKGEASDGIVPISSAFGDLSNIGSNAPATKFDGVKHTGMGVNTSVIEWVIDKLDGELVDKSFSDYVQFKNPEKPLENINNHEWSTFFENIALYVLGINNAIADEDVINLNVDKSIISPNESVTFSVSNIIQGKVLSGITLTNGRFISLKDNTPPYEWTLPFSNEISGKKKFQAIAVIDGRPVISNTITINISPNLSTLTSIYFKPSDSIVLYPGTTHNLMLFGLFSDGFDRDLTQNDSTVLSENIIDGVNVTTGNSPTISISPEGVILAQEPGKAEVVASINGKTAAIKITVVKVESDSIQNTDSDSDGDNLTDAQEDVIGTNKYHPDSDGDGSPDDVEVGADPSNPLNSDGAGAIDALDNTRMTIKDTSDKYVSISTSAGTLTTPYGKKLTDYPDRGSDLAQHSMTRGLLSFRIEGLTAGQQVDVTLDFDSLPAGTDKYLKYGTKLPGGGVAEWYEFTNFDVSGNRIILHLTDNQLGDSNPVSGVISDPGGPASSASSGGGGGGGSSGSSTAVVTTTTDDTGTTDTTDDTGVTDTTTDDTDTTPTNNSSGGSLGIIEVMALLLLFLSQIMMRKSKMVSK